MAEKRFAHVPPPAPLPEAETVRVVELLDKYVQGEIDLVCVMGPTASGKTRYAVSMAREFNRLCSLRRQRGKTGTESVAFPTGAEIISGDSRQIFKGMDLGTGKDIKEYGEIPYHMIDILPAGAKYNIYDYQCDFARVYADCRRRGVIPILCGGSGLYIEAVTRSGEYRLGDDEEIYRLLPKRTFFIATLVDRETRRARISQRLKERLEQGMLLEIKSLLASGLSKEDLMYYGLEYKYLTLYACGDMDVDEMFINLQVAIFKFAKRQMTWLRGMEKDGIRIHWVNPDADIG